MGNPNIVRNVENDRPTYPPKWVAVAVVVMLGLLAGCGGSESADAAQQVGPQGARLSNAITAGLADCFDPLHDSDGSGGFFEFCDKAQAARAANQLGCLHPSFQPGNIDCEPWRLAESDVPPYYFDLEDTTEPDTAEPAPTEPPPAQQAPTEAPPTEPPPAQEVPPQELPEIPIGRADGPSPADVFDEVRSAWRVRDWDRFAQVSSEEVLAAAQDVGDADSIGPYDPIGNSLDEAWRCSLAGETCSDGLWQCDAGGGLCSGELLYESSAVEECCAAIFQLTIQDVDGSYLVTSLVFAGSAG